jgi:hypothetical protein
VGKERKTYDIKRNKGHKELLISMIKCIGAEEKDG